MADGLLRVASRGAPVGRGGRFGIPGIVPSVAPGPADCGSVTAAFRLRPGSLIGRRGKPGGPDPPLQSRRADPHGATISPMPHHAEDTRVIDPDAPVYNATLVRREDQTDELAYFWVRFDGEPTPFQPGQYMTTGVVVDGKLLQRPYSVASPPQASGTDGYEFYVRVVPVIRFTTALWRLPLGHRMRMIGPKGKFLLEPDDDRTHLYVSTGTGIAPFIAMIRTLLIEGRPRPVVMLNGVSYANDLGYRPLL